MSREMPNRPTTAPEASCRGPRVIEKVARALAGLQPLLAGDEAVLLHHPGLVGGEGLGRGRRQQS
jgi:hypothetical protein